MSMIDLCPGCGKPTSRVKTRCAREHVPELDADPTVQRQVRLTLLRCDTDGCTNWIIPWVALPPRPTSLRYLPSRVREIGIECATELSVPVGTQSR